MSMMLGGPCCNTAYAHATLPTMRPVQLPALATSREASRCVRGSPLIAAFTAGGS